MIKFSMEIQEIMCELQNMKEVVDAVSSVVDDVFQSLSAIYKEYSVRSLEFNCLKC